MQRISDELVSGIYPLGRRAKPTSDYTYADEPSPEATAAAS